MKLRIFDINSRQVINKWTIQHEQEKKIILIKVFTPIFWSIASPCLTVLDLATTESFPWHADLVLCACVSLILTNKELKTSGRLHDRNQT